MQDTKSEALMECETMEKNTGSASAGCVAATEHHDASAESPALFSHLSGSYRQIVRTALRDYAAKSGGVGVLADAANLMLSKDGAAVRKAPLDLPEDIGESAPRTGRDEQDPKWVWHAEGSRAFILEDDGSTVCEIVCPAQNDRAAVAREIVQARNAIVFKEFSVATGPDQGLLDYRTAALLAGAQYDDSDESVGATGSVTFTTQELVKFVGYVLLNHRSTTQPFGSNDLDYLAVDRFAVSMKRKLTASTAKGRGGWQQAGLHQRLSDLLREHVAKGDPVDVANFAMFLHQRGETIAPPLADDALCLLDLIDERGDGRSEFSPRAQHMMAEIEQRLRPSPSNKSTPSVDGPAPSDRSDKAAGL